MRPTLMFFMCLALSTVGCASFAEKRGTIGKFEIYPAGSAGDKTMLFANIAADNQSSHDLSGEVTCGWYANGSILSAIEETKSFNTPAGTKKLLGFSSLAERGRLRIHCEITKLICHDCVNRVIIENQKNLAFLSSF